MTATSIIEFDSTMQEFAAHWANVNTTIAPNPPFVLANGYTRDNFITDQSVLATATNDVIAKENALVVATGLLATRRAALQPRIVQFNTIVRGLLGGTGYDNALPSAFQVNTPLPKVLRALEDMRQLWSTINALGSSVPDFVPPLQYGDGYVYATFLAEYNALAALGKTYENAAKDAKVSREKRNVLLPPFRARMVDYRKRLPARLTLGNALVASMPKITPKAGSTPDAPGLSARWDAALSKAVLTWTLSPSPNITGYSVRVCTGATYRSKNESVVGGTSAEATGFSTDAGLAVSGNTASFKVYAVNATGNARGSLAVVVARP